VKNRVDVLVNPGDATGRRPRGAADVFATNSAQAGTRVCATAGDGQDAEQADGLAVGGQRQSRARGFVVAEIGGIMHNVLCQLNHHSNPSLTTRGVKMLFARNIPF
jgi:hypothetical protein